MSSRIDPIAMTRRRTGKPYEAAAGQEHAASMAQWSPIVHRHPPRCSHFQRGPVLFPQVGRRSDLLSREDRI
jgi:hypothetical protein